MIRVTFKGAEETQAFLTHASEAIQRATKKSLKQAATLVKQEAIWNCPVRTGYLRSTIFYSVNGDEYGFTVGARAKYGGYVEYGTRYMRAQPYIRPAFIFVMQNIKSATGKEIEKELESIK
jgi:HK97 gp10 family phage protein